MTQIKTRNEAQFNENKEQEEIISPVTLPNIDFIRGSAMAENFNLEGLP